MWLNCICKPKAKVNSTHPQRYFFLKMRMIPAKTGAIIESAQALVMCPASMMMML